MGSSGPLVDGATASIEAVGGASASSAVYRIRTSSLGKPDSGADTTDGSVPLGQLNAGDSQTAALHSVSPPADPEAVITLDNQVMTALEVSVSPSEVSA